MKRIKTLMVVVAMVAITSLTATAKGSDEVRVLKVEPVSDMDYRLTYLVDGKSDVRIDILDYNGKTLHSEYIHEEKSFSRVYKFEDLDAGAYTFKVVDSKGSISKDIVHGIQYDKQVTASISEDEAGKIKLVVRGEKPGPIFVNILDSRKNVIFDEVIDESKSFYRVYDVSRIRSPYLTFKVYGNGEEIVKKDL